MHSSLSGLRVLGASGEGVGDDAHSWAVDGTRQNKWHKGGKAWRCKWQIGDVIGLACDSNTTQLKISKVTGDPGRLRLSPADRAKQERV